VKPEEAAGDDPEETFTDDSAQMGLASSPD